MRFTHVLAVAALLSITGAARANSPVPANYIDDFGLLTPSATSPTAEARIAPPSIPSNYVDDFGLLTPSSSPTMKARIASPSIPSNYVDDFGVASATAAAPLTAFSVNR